MSNACKTTSLTVYKPGVNRAVKDVKLYQHAYDFLGLPVRRYPEQFINNRNRALSTIYHPDVNHSPDSRNLMANINVSIDAVRQYSAFNGWKKIVMQPSDPIGMTPGLKVKTMAIKSAYLGGMFMLSDVVFDPAQQYLLYGTFDKEMYLDTLATSGRSTAVFIGANLAGSHLFNMSYPAASSYAMGGLMIGDMKALSEDYRGLAIVQGSVGLTSFLVTSNILNARLLARGKNPLVAGAIAFYGGDLANRASAVAINNLASTELGNKFVNSDALVYSGRVMAPAVDWMYYSYIFNGNLKMAKYAVPAMKKAPLIGTGLTAICITISSWDKITSGDSWTMANGFYGVAKEGVIMYGSILAATGMTTVTIETGPGAFFIGAGTYVGADLVFRGAANYAETRSGLKSFFDEKLVTEPLRDIGIMVRVIPSQITRPAEITKQLNKQTSDDIRMLLVGKSKLPSVDEKGNKIMVKLPDMLKKTGIVSISVEDLKDLTPYTLYQICEEAKKVNPDGSKILKVELKFAGAGATMEGTGAKYSIKISGFSKDPKKAKVTVVAAAFHPIQKVFDEKDLSMEELSLGVMMDSKGEISSFTPLIDLYNGEKPLKRTISAEYVSTRDFFSKPQMGVLQISQALIDLEIIDPKTQGLQEFIKIVNDCSYEEFRKYMKNKANAELVQKVLTYGLILFQRRVHKYNPSLIKEIGVFGKEDARMLNMVWTARKQGLDPSLENIEMLATMDVRFKKQVDEQLIKMYEKYELQGWSNDEINYIIKCMVERTSLWAYDGNFIQTLRDNGIDLNGLYSSDELVRDQTIISIIKENSELFWFAYSVFMQKISEENRMLADEKGVVLSEKNAFAHKLPEYLKIFEPKRDKLLR